MSAKPTRILCVMGSLMGGGAERQMVLLLNNLDRAAFAPTLCLLVRDGELRSELRDDVPVVDLDKKSPRDAPRLVAGLARLVQTTEPALMLSKVDYTNIITVLAVAVARSKAAVVLGEESVPSDALAVATHAMLRKALMRWAYQRAHWVVAPSPGVVADLRGPLGIDRTPISVIPNMIDQAAIRAAAKAPVSLPFADCSRPLVVCAGRLVRGKGQDDLLSAMALLTGANLVLLGDGPDRPRLETLAAALQVQDRVAFAGFVANPFAVMARAAVFVSPSHSESFGNVIIEAMATGVPVVSTRIPAGPAWLIRDGDNGLFANPHDPAHLAYKIRVILDDPALGAAVTRRAQQGLTQFDVGTVTGAYASLLGRLVESGGARGRP